MHRLWRFWTGSGDNHMVMIPGFGKTREFLNQLNHYQLLKEGPSWSRLLGYITNNSVPICFEYSGHTTYRVLLITAERTPGCQQTSLVQKNWIYFDFIQVHSRWIKKSNSIRIASLYLTTSLMKTGISLRFPNDQRHKNGMERRIKNDSAITHRKPFQKKTLFIMLPLLRDISAWRKCIVIRSPVWKCIGWNGP
jgi:hypothetical protein